MWYLGSGAGRREALIMNEYIAYCGLDLPISFQFHHTQMDGVHAERFLENLQSEIKI